MISAITNRGRLYFMVFGQRFDAGVFVDFLKRLTRQVGRMLYLIMDRHPVHRSSRAKKWLARNGQRIRLFHLPGYRPELNPDEVLHQDVKSNAVGHHEGGHPSAFSSQALRQLEQDVICHPDATLEELRERSGVRVSLVAFHQRLRQMVSPPDVPPALELDFSDGQNM